MTDSMPPPLVPPSSASASAEPPASVPRPAGATGPLRSRSRLLDLLFILACAAALVAMQRTLPSYEDKTAPFRVRGRIGEVVKGRSFAMRLERVELARNISAPALLRGVSVRTTSGIWVIVHGQMSATRESMMLGTAALRTRDGLVYRVASDRFSGRSLLIGQTNQPVLARRGVLVFELPPDKLAGAVLEAAEGQLDQRLDSLLEISLGLDDEAVKKALANASLEYKLGGPGQP